MALVSTTMKDLLSAYRELLKDYEDDTIDKTIAGIKTFKLGIFGGTIIYPAIQLMPIYELHGGARSGRQYRVDRLIEASIYVKMSDIKSSSIHLQELSQALLDIFYDTSNPNNYKMTNGDGDDTVWHFSPGSIDYDRFTEGTTIIQMASIPITFTSWETMPSPTLSSSITDTDLRGIGEYIYGQLEAAAGLNEVKFFYNHAFPPVKVGKGAVVTVMEISDERTRRETGRDNPFGYIDIVVWTKGSPYQDYLNYNLDIVEDLKDVVQALPHMGGKTWFSQIERINFGYVDELSLYASQLMLRTQAYNAMPQY